MKNNKSLIIVEDDIDIREELSSILTDEGYSITGFENGKIALDFLIKASDDELPDCLIVDLMMPVMSGGVLLNELLKNDPERFNKIPVIVASAKGSPKVELESLPSSIVRIRKPFDLDELLETIESMIKSGRQEQ